MIQLALEAYSPFFSVPPEQWPGRGLPNREIDAAGIHFAGKRFSRLLKIWIARAIFVVLAGKRRE